MRRLVAQVGFVDLRQGVLQLRHGIEALRRRRVFATAAIATLAAALYWGVVASDRYVAEARIVIQRTDINANPGVDFAALVNGLGGSSRGEQLLLREHLLSLDMLKSLDAALDLRAHYSDVRRDPLSRMWSAAAPIEWFHRHYLARVSVEFDEYAGVLVIRAQAFDPETAQSIVALLIEQGERFMNAQGHRLAAEQVAFLEGEVARAQTRALEARQRVLAFQDEQGLVSPEGSAANAQGIIGSLEAQLANARTRRNALLGYLMPTSPNVVEVDVEIRAIERQLEDERARLAAPGGATLNRTVEAFQRLAAEATFAEEVYRSALGALENGRIEATRTLKKVSVVQSPSMPQYPLEPRRLHNTVVFALAALLVAGIVHLLHAIVRDHED